MRTVVLSKDVRCLRLDRADSGGRGSGWFYVADFLIDDDKMSPKTQNFEKNLEEINKSFGLKYNYESQINSKTRDWINSKNSGNKSHVWKEKLNDSFNEQKESNQKLETDAVEQNLGENCLFATCLIGNMKEKTDEDYEDIDKLRESKSIDNSEDRECENVNEKYLKKGTPLVVPEENIKPEIKTPYNPSSKIDDSLNKSGMFGFQQTDCFKIQRNESTLKQNDYKRTSFASRNLNLNTNKNILQHNPNQFNNRNVILALDKDGDLICLSEDCVEKFGEIKNQPWFYPCKTTPQQISLFLNSVKQKGTFVVYSSLDNVKESEEITELKDHFCLAVVSQKEEVLHYPIKITSIGNYQLSDDSISFLNINDLVKYYQNSRGNIATRLRRPLKFVNRHITTFEEYDAKDEIKKKFVIIKNRCIYSNRLYRKFCGIYDNGVKGSIKVDVKILIDESSQANIDDLFYEAYILKCLHHHNVLSFIGVSFLSRPFHLIMENSHYGNLRSCISRDILPDLEVSNLKNIFIQILRALCYLESRKCIHRNLSVSSFYVTDKGSIKLGDFDKARIMESLKDYFIAEESEDVSLRNSAPEVLTDLKYSIKTDVWACGILMWELFSKGSFPYDGLSPAKIIFEIVSGERFLERPSQCDEKTYEIIMQCWNVMDYKRPTYSKILKCLKSRQAVNIQNTSFRKIPNKDSTWKMSDLKSNLQSSWKNTIDRRFTVGGVPGFFTPSTLRKSLMSMDGKKFRQMAIRSKEALLKGSRSMHNKSASEDLKKSQDTANKDVRSEMSMSNEDDDYDDDTSLTSRSIYMNLTSSETGAYEANMASSVPTSSSFLQDKSLMISEDKLACNENEEHTITRRPKSVEPFPKESPRLDVKLWNLSRKKMMKRNLKSIVHNED